MKQIYILGIKVTDISRDKAIKEIDIFLNTNQKGYIATPNPEICLLGWKNKSYRRIFNNAVLSIPDGVGLKFGGKIIKSNLSNITKGVDLCQEIIKLAEQKNYSILILGGIEEVGLRAQKILKQKYPALNINYLHGGIFNDKGKSNQSDLINQINVLKPDIIFVCLGAPKQEWFMAENLNNIDTKLMLGVGGTIDFLAEQVKRAPQSWQNLGLEWLWRLIQEPWRWKRIINAVIIFPLTCIYWRISNEFIYRNNVAGFIINGNKQIFIAKHSEYGQWKLPQGGAKQAKTDEEYKEEIIREMTQELGTDNFEVIKLLKNCYRYKFPKNMPNWNKDRFVGQRQTLVLLKFLGKDSDIKLDPHEHSAWQWATKDNILQIASPERHSLIKIGLINFKDYI